MAELHKRKRRVVVRSLAAVTLATLVLVAPADAATKKTKKPTKKKPTTTKVLKPAVIPPTPTTLPPLTPPPPETPTSLVSIAPPPPTLPLQEQNRLAFEQMFRARDIWRFESDITLSADAEAFRRGLNGSASIPVWTGADARIMLTTTDDREVAIVIALVADPTAIRPEVLTSTINQIGRTLRDPLPLKVQGGAAIAGVDEDGFGVAFSAFDRYLIQVLAVNRQQAQDAAFLVTTNMGRQLTL
jgi:hypothetical protein